MKQKIIVTGGTGYLGSHTTVALQQANFDVIIIDNLMNSKLSVLDGIAKITGIKPEYENVDCTDLNSMEKVFCNHHDVVGVIHFAALKAVGESVQKPLKYFRNNILSLLNVLTCMTKYNVPNIVFSSSATVYGEPDKLPVTEQTPLKPATSPYGQTKVIGENIIQDTIRAFPDMNAVLLRYFNPIGAHPSAEIGELPLGVPANLLPYITQTAIGIREKLSVFGNDYNTADGYCVRDYIDVNDLANAHVAAVKHMLETKQKLGIFNIGTGRGISVMELIKTFEQVTGQTLNYEITNRRPGDVAEIWADATLANQELKWTAKIPLKETLLSAWKWQQKISQQDS